MIHNAEWVECKVCGRVLDHVVCVGRDERQYVKAMPCPGCTMDSWYGGVCEAKNNLALWNKEDFESFMPSVGIPVWLFNLCLKIRGWRITRRDKSNL